MIINRYIIRNIHQGTLLALLVLVSLSMFFIFVSQLDNLGEGDYGLLQVIEHVVLRLPGKLVEFLPLAILLGSILSLGALASNSEIIAMQASGVSMKRLLGSALQAAMVVALLGFLLADWVVPVSETGARNVKTLMQDKAMTLGSNASIWIKDESRVVHIAALMPNGLARNIEIFQLDEAGRLYSITRALGAVPRDQDWLLLEVKQTLVGDAEPRSQEYDELLYPGKLSHQLLAALIIEPRQMSTGDLSTYLDFLSENKLDTRVARLVFWQKIFAPLSIIVMCLLALPFVLGAQRQANNGQRMLLGILLGLCFVVVDKLLVQLGLQFEINAALVALSPNLLFFALAIYLLLKKQSHPMRKRAPIVR